MFPSWLVFSFLFYVAFLDRLLYVSLTYFVVKIISNHNSNISDILWIFNDSQHKDLWQQSSKLILSQKAYHVVQYKVS